MGSTISETADETGGRTAEVMGSTISETAEETGGRTAEVIGSTTELRREVMGSRMPPGVLEDAGALVMVGSSLVGELVGTLLLGSLEAGSLVGAELLGSAEVGSALVGAGELLGSALVGEDSAEVDVGGGTRVSSSSSVGAGGGSTTGGGGSTTGGGGSTMGPTIGPTTGTSPRPRASPNFCKSSTGNCLFSRRLACNCPLLVMPWPDARVTDEASKRVSNPQKRVEKRIICCVVFYVKECEGLDTTFVT